MRPVASTVEDRSLVGPPLIFCALGVGELVVLRVGRCHGADLYASYVVLAWAEGKRVGVEEIASPIGATLR